MEREKDELHDTVRRLHHDRDLAERKADLLAFELRRSVFWLSCDELIDLYKRACRSHLKLDMSPAGLPAQKKKAAWRALLAVVHDNMPYPPTAKTGTKKRQS